MKLEDKAILAGMVVGLIVGGPLGYGLTSEDYKAKAIEHGCAGYDRASGKFQWNMEKVK